MNIREETDQLIEISLRYMVAKGCRQLISKSRSWQAEVSLRLGNYYVWTEVELWELIYHLCKCTVSVEWTETAKTQVPATLGLKVLSHGTTRTFSSWSLEGAFRFTGTGRACHLSLSSPSPASLPLHQGLSATMFVPPQTQSSRPDFPNCEPGKPVVS